MISSSNALILPTMLKRLKDRKVTILILILSCWLLAVFVMAPNIELELLKTANQNLKAAGLVGAHVTSDGRDLTLRGLIKNKKERKKALRIIRNTTGVSELTDELKIIKAPVKIQERVIYKEAAAKVEVKRPKRIKKIKRKDTAEYRKRRLKAVLQQSVHFFEGTPIILNKSYAPIVYVAKTMRRYPEINLEIRGYADSIGKAKSNYLLARERAIAVHDRLIELGINKKRLKIKSYGEKRPRSTNRTKMGRSENRRVEFRLTRG